jgi:hypothetical protein
LIINCQTTPCHISEDSNLCIHAVRPSNLTFLYVFSFPCYYWTKLSTGIALQLQTLVNLRLTSAVAGTIQLSIYESNTMDGVGGGGGGRGRGLMWAIVQKCWSRRRYKSLLLLVLCAWTARLGDFQACWVYEFLLMTRERFRTEAVTSTGISRRKPRSLRLSVSILYFVNLYGDVKVIRKHYISVLLPCSLIRCKNRATIHCLPFK